MSAIFTPPPSLRAATDGRRRALISLTPLIDVVFILLVFFMLASSFLDWRAIDLDPPARAGAASALTGAMLVDVRTDDLRLSGESLPLNLIIERLKQVAEDHPDRAIVVRPSNGVSLQRTIRVLDRLNGSGMQSISLTLPEQIR